MQELAPKTFYKLSEVCQATDTQPYVLRFWESEFPQLKPGMSASGQRMYRKRDVDVVRRIKELLDEEECTLDRARSALADEARGGKHPRPTRPPGPAAISDSVPVRPVSPQRRGRSAVEAAPRTFGDGPSPLVGETTMVPRQRYEAAVDEVDHLRLTLKELEKSSRRAESEAEHERRRADRAVQYLERLQQILS